MKLYNTLTKKVEKFIPNEEGKVKMYTCGPTVYHFAHIGNLRTYISEDVLEKGLKFIGYDVERVMNITDVGHNVGDGDSGEDKMSVAARREKKSSFEIAKYYTDCFFEDCCKLNVRKPDVVSNATDNIDMYITMITKLLEKLGDFFGIESKREKEIREAAKLEAQLEMIKTNPYTNEAISDEEDLKIYKLQKAIEEKGGDPISDLPKALAEQNRKEAHERKALAEQEKAKQEKLSKQASDLFAKYPEAQGIATKDKELINLIETKGDSTTSNWTMTDCYEYLVMKRKYENLLQSQQEAQTKKNSAVKEATNKYHKIPSSQPNGGRVSDDDYSTMSDEEYLKSEAEKSLDFF